VRSAWEAASTDQRRSVLREIIERIDVHVGTPGRFTINADVTWRPE
jgi:hypothetical protein